jgi:hypothetical protein
VGCSRAEDTRVRSYDETLEGCALRSCMDGAGNPCADSRIDVNVLQGTSALCRTVLVHLPMLVSICDRAVTGANSAPHGEQLTRLAGPAFGHLELLTPTPNLHAAGQVRVQVLVVPLWRHTLCVVPHANLRHVFGPELEHRGALEDREPGRMNMYGGRTQTPSIPRTDISLSASPSPQIFHRI